MNFGLCHDVVLVDMLVKHQQPWAPSLLQVFHHRIACVTRIKKIFKISQVQQMVLFREK
jgi:hypothetical protein